MQQKKESNDHRQNASDDDAAGPAAWIDWKLPALASDFYLCVTHEDAIRLGELVALAMNFSVHGMRNECQPGSGQQASQDEDPEDGFCKQNFLSRGQMLWNGQ